MRSRFLLLILCGMLFSSCGSRERKVLVKCVSGMEKTVDSLQNIINTTEKSDYISDSVDLIIHKIEKNYRHDTIGISIVEKINIYKNLPEVILRNSGNLAKAKQVIPEMAQNLFNLKHDIKNGVNERSKYKEYVNFEQKKIEEVKELLTYYVTENNRAIHTFDSLHPIMIHFADSLGKIHP